MKKNIFILSFLFLLLSCGVEENPINSNTGATSTGEIIKKDFYIETISYENLDNKVEIKKIGKVLSKSNISVSSLASGKIHNIYKKEGDSVKVGETIAVLSDTIGNYGLAIERAKNNLERTKLNYESTKITLDKAVSDTYIALNKTQKDYEILKKDIEITIKKAQDDISENSLNNSSSKSSLDIEKLEQVLEKTKLDYENKLLSDNQTMNSFKNSFKTEYFNLTNSYSNIIDFADSLLGVTPENRTNNDSIENYLGARNFELKTSLENQLLDIIRIKNDFGQKGGFEDMNEEDMKNEIDTIGSHYIDMKGFLSELKNLMNNSISSNTLTDAMLSGYIIQINGFQSSIQMSYSAFITSSNNINNFLNTYKENQSSIIKSIELLEKDIEIAKKSINISTDSLETALERSILNLYSNLKNAEISLKNAKLNNENAIKNREVTLRQLENSIKETELSLSQANKEYTKLTIISPINGKISNVNVDKGQDVNNGTPIVNIITDDNTEVEIGLSNKEIKYISKGNSVKIFHNGNVYEGIIDTINNYLDDNLNFKVKILVKSNDVIVGNFVDVSIPISLENKIISLNSINISGESKGIIYVLENGEIIKQDISFGTTWGEYIEIIYLEELSNKEIILSDISNYDKEKFNLIKKNDPEEN